MALILCIGIDPELIATRRLILESAGHTVVSTMGQRELEDACAEQRFDVAIIGEAMSSKVKRWACQLIRENCPSARVLELHPPYAGKSLNDADAWLAMPTQHPEDLEKTVNSLVAQRR
ncbi:MAG TPA: response regulator [Candidatus Angelobacter sp.]|nr:response regulator [Candidatus Angelobacter sp.]